MTGDDENPLILEYSTVEVLVLPLTVCSTSLKITFGSNPSQSVSPNIYHYKLPMHEDSMEEMGVTENSFTTHWDISVNEDGTLEKRATVQVEDFCFGPMQDIAVVRNGALDTNLTDYHSLRETPPLYRIGLLGSGRQNSVCYGNLEERRTYKIGIDIIRTKTFPLLVPEH